MSDQIETYGELRQVRNFARGLLDTRRIQEEKPEFFLKGVLSGLQTIIPEGVKRSGILESAPRRRVVNALGDHQVRLNDYIDFEGAGRSDLLPLTVELKHTEQVSRARVEAAINDIPDSSERDKTRLYFENAVRELQFVEKHIRQERLRGGMSFEDAEKYRSLSLIINEVVDTAFILGTDQFEGRLDTIPADQMNWQTIWDKYSWAINGEFRNDSERALVIMHNVAMATQIDDDWFDVNIDRLLNVPSFGIAALEEVHGDVEQARKFLRGIKKIYLQKAHDLGIGRIPEFAFTEFVKNFKWLSRWSLRSGKFDSSSPLRDRWAKFVNKRMGKREKLYITGDLDHRSNDTE